ncbi:MAG: aminotransferase class V-fold PLP-dependent enzyme [Thermoplasmata archaeon]
MENFDFDMVLRELEKSLKPYNRSIKIFDRIPEKGLKEHEVIEELSKFSENENRAWKMGKVSGAVYYGESDLLQFYEKLYHLYSQTNALHPDIWPSLTKFEREIVAMSSSLMHGNENVRGAVSSGGTESILLAIKTYRDYFREKKGITEPEIILPETVHPAFLKACDYFSIKPVFSELDNKYRADIEKVKEKINDHTIGIVGSAPNFPFGTYDPIKELSEIAFDRGIGMHVDACLGGFIDPFVRELGYEIPEFDFSLDGVTSISMDTHKYGYAPKGTSVILYRNGEFFQKQIFVHGTGREGIYFTPTLLGSRPGFPIVAAWAVMLIMGYEGYKARAKSILETGKYIKDSIKRMDALKIVGDPLWVIAITSDEIDPYLLWEAMGKKGWFLSGLSNPASFHIALTVRHTLPCVKEDFINDLKQSIELVKKGEIKSSSMAPIYGMSSTIPKEMVDLFLKNVVEWLYSI